MYYIGVDLGTSSVKLLLMDDDGNIVNTVTKEYPISFPKPGWSEQNPTDWYEKTVEGIKELISNIDSSKVAGISFGGQMHGLVILDKNDNVIRPAILWNDGRTTKECDFLNNQYGKDKLTNSDVFHTCYWAKNYYEGSTAIAKLDVDDTTSYGPETTTIYELNDNMKYSYYVHDFTNGYSSSSTAMAASGAKVQVYAGNVCYFTFNVPNEGGTWWHVFDYDPATDALTPVNAMSYSN